MSSGCDGEEVVLILNDTQLVHSSFLEDVSNLLNTGEIPNLYDEDDQARMEESLSKFVKQRDLVVNKDNIHQVFLERLQGHFHVFLCMSPVGDALRQRCRNFPSLINCCTLDWFDTWPSAALKTVASQFLS